MVDLTSGAVTKLPVRSTLAYYSPGCGVDESAVLTQAGSGDLAKTRVFRVDAATGSAAEPIVVPGQLTSPVPVRDTIVAADGHSLVKLAPDGTRTLFAPAANVPFGVAADADGGVVYLDLAGGVTTVRRVDDTRPRGDRVRTLATGKAARIGLDTGSGGRVFITGKPDRTWALPGAVRLLDVPATAEVSTEGAFAVTKVEREADPRVASTGAITLSGKATGTGKEVGFAVDPAAPSPDGVTASGSPTNPVDDDRWCSVPRNDPRNQVVQPKPRQVEWAVNQAVRGVLNVQRPANWKNLGMPAYQVQGGLFRAPQLDGGGFIPSQIVLGIAAQESNLWQASRAALPGVTGNPLIGNFYGRAIYDTNPDDDWDIHWNKSDCGYGVMQVTDGMRLAGHEKPGDPSHAYQTQRAIALDFTANIASGVLILEQKWNQVRRAGMKIANGDPSSLETWFYAVWAYNSGFHPDNNDGKPWGVGWGNNPANPNFKPDREAFLETSYGDARYPQYWPYPEKVLGWAGHPIESVESPGKLVKGFNYAWWNDAQFRATVKPPRHMFCDQTNECWPGQANLPNYPGSPPGGEGDVRGEPAGPCAHRTDGYFDLK